MALVFARVGMIVCVWFSRRGSLLFCGFKREARRKLDFFLGRGTPLNKKTTRTDVE